MTKYALKIRDLGKEYTLGEQRSASLREAIQSVWKKVAHRNEKIKFWALQNIDLDIYQGESIGIIGRNGAGKSTLLKIISRITDPSEGSVEINGRISSLLEVGTGFHPELTGAENIYLNGTILGMTRKEISKKYDEIVKFSDVEKFINTPVKHYSSGMKVRLAFSVAAHLEPEILLIDEVLAVGDSEFQKKCLDKMEDATLGGRTVLFVSHNLGAVRMFCKRTAVLEGGKLLYFGDTSEAIDRYLDLGSIEESLEEIERSVGNGSLLFQKVEFLSFNSEPVGSILSGQDLKIRLKYNAKEDLKDVTVILQVVSMEGIILFTCINYLTDKKFTVSQGNGYFDCDISTIPLNTGRYLLNIACHVEMKVVEELKHVSPFHVDEGGFYSTGKLPAFKQGVLINHSWSAN